MLPCAPSALLIPVQPIEAEVSPDCLCCGTRRKSGRCLSIHFAGAKSVLVTTKGPSRERREARSVERSIQDASAAIFFLLPYVGRDPVAVGPGGFRQPFILLGNQGDLMM
ncbi:unnamed protein product, partial [Ectocarpus sp. 12 AP-2014]